MTGTPAEFELRCERCGYTIEGLPPTGQCPECGLAIDRSTPERRSGSPWQERPGIAAWTRTLAWTLRRPWSSMRQIRIEERRSRSLRRANLIIASGLTGVLPTAEFGVQLIRSETPMGLGAPAWAWMEERLGLLLSVIGMGVLAAIVWAAVLGLLHLLTSVEARGIRLYGRMHRSRVTPTVALAITAHATAGWVLGGLLIAIGFGASLVMHEVAMEANVGWVRGGMMLSPILLPAVGGIVGLMTFETLTYLGVRRNRFANRDRRRDV